MHRRTPTVDLLAPFHVLRRGSAPAPAPGAEPKLSAFDPAFSPEASSSASPAPIPLPSSVSALSRAGSRRASAPKLSLMATEPMPSLQSPTRAQASLAPPPGLAATPSTSPERGAAPVAVPRAVPAARSASSVRSRPATVYAVTVKRKPVPKLEDLEAEATFHRARRVSVSERSAPSLSRQSSSTGLSSSLPNDSIPPPPPLPVFPLGEGWEGFGTVREPSATRSSESDEESMRTCPEDDWVDEGVGMTRTRSKAGSVSSGGKRSRRGSAAHAVARQGRRSSVQGRSLPPSPSLISVSFGKANLNGHGPPPPRPARKGPRFEGRKGSVDKGWEGVTSPAMDGQPAGRRQSAVSKHSRLSSTGSAAEWCDALEHIPPPSGMPLRRPSEAAPFPQSVADEPEPPVPSGLGIRSPSPLHEEPEEQAADSAHPSDVHSSPSEFMTPASHVSPRSSYPLLPPAAGLTQPRPRPQRRPSVASSLASVGEGAESVEEDLLDAWMELMGPSGVEVDANSRRHGRRGSERLKSISEDSGVPLSMAFPTAPGSSNGSRGRRGSIFPSGPSASSHDGHGEAVFGSPLRKDAGMYARSVGSSVSVATGAIDSPMESEPFHRERRLSSTASTFSRASSSAFSGPARKADPGANFFGGFSWSAAGGAAKKASGMPGPRDAVTPSSVALSSTWSDSRSHPASDASASVSSHHPVEPLRVRKTASGGVAPIMDGEMPPPASGRRGSGAGLMPSFLRRRSEQVARKPAAEEIGNLPSVQPLRTNRSASVQGLVGRPGALQSQASFDSQSSTATTPAAPTPRARDSREGPPPTRPVSTFYSPFDSRSESLPPLFSHNKARPSSRQSQTFVPGPRSDSRQSLTAAPPVTGLPRLVGEGVSPYAQPTEGSERERDGPSAEWLANEKRRRSSAGLVTRSGPIKMGRLGSRQQGSVAEGMEDMTAFLEKETREIMAA